MIEVMLQLFGGLLIGIGLYAFVDKWQLTGSVKLENVYDVILNVSLIMVLMGGVVFIVSFAGCVGALRENTCLLKFVTPQTLTPRENDALFLVLVMSFDLLSTRDGYSNNGVHFSTHHAVRVGGEFHR